MISLLRDLLLDLCAEILSPGMGKQHNTASKTLGFSRICSSLTTNLSCAYILPGLWGEICHGNLSRAAL